VIYWKPLYVSAVCSEIQQGDASSTHLFSVKELNVIFEVGFAEILLQKKISIWIWAPHCFQSCYWLRHYYGAQLHLNRFNLTDNPMCSCIEGEQSVEHLIHVCRILEPQRNSDTTYNDQRRDLAPHKQRTRSQTLKRFFAIC